MTIGTQISDMTVEDIPEGGFVPFIVTNPATGLSPLRNYRYDLGSDLLTRVSYSALAEPTGAELVGSTGPSNVQADLDARPTSATLASTSGAGLIGWIRDASGAFIRSVADWFDDRPSVMDFIPLVERVKIRLRTSTADLSPYFQKAWDFASDRQCKFIVPGGLYYVGCPNTSVNATVGNDYQGYQSWEDPQFGTTLKYGVTMQSNVEMEVEAGAIIKAADDISTDADPQNWVLFYSLEALTNVRITGNGTIDGNAVNNKMSPNRANTGDPQEQRYNRFHQAAFMWEGPFGKVDNFLVDGPTFQNFNGANVIISGRIATPALGINHKVTNARFMEVGLDTYDCSVVNLMCDGGEISDCHFENAVEYAPTAANLTGLSALYETHGTNINVRDNTSKNSSRTGFISYALNYRDWVAIDPVLYAGYPWGHAAQNIFVTSNEFFDVKLFGCDIGFAPITGVSTVPSNIHFSDNYVGMTSSDTNVASDNAPSVVICIGSGGVIGPIHGLFIERNVADRPASPSGRTSNFITLSLQADGYENVSIKGNTGTGFTIGEYLLTDPDMGINSLTLDGNTWLNPEGGTVPASSKIGTFIFAQGGEMDMLYYNDAVLDTRVTNGWDKGLAISVGDPTTIGRVYVAKTARFDDRFDVDDAVDGFVGNPDLTIDRLLGVAVTGAYGDTSYGTLTGAIVTASLPGVLSTDVLEFSLSNSADPNTAVTNLGGFTPSAYRTAADQVGLALRNVTAGTLFTTPGFNFRITAYPGR
jgi:hypothetical protein